MVGEQIGIAVDGLSIQHDTTQVTRVFRGMSRVLHWEERKLVQGMVEALLVQTVKKPLSWARQSGSPSPSPQAWEGGLL